MKKGHRDGQMHSGGKGKGDDGFRSSKYVGDGYAPGPGWKVGTGNVVESRLNKGGDKAWRGKRSGK